MLSPVQKLDSSGQGDEFSSSQMSHGKDHDSELYLTVNGIRKMMKMVKKKLVNDFCHVHQKWFSTSTPVPVMNPGKCYCTDHDDLYEQEDTDEIDSSDLADMDMDVHDGFDSDMESPD